MEVFQKYIKHKQILICGITDIPINIIGDKSTKICSFDVNEETSRHEPWTASAEQYKQNIDKFLSGGTVTYPNGTKLNYEGFMKKYKNKTFKEDLGEYTYNATNDENNNIKTKKKRVIIYTLQ